VTKKNGMCVLIADDRPHVRSALRVLLRVKLGADTIAEASDLEQTLERVSLAQPDLVLLDWDLPAKGTAPAMTRLRAACPNLPVIALSSRPEVRRAALAAGANAFASKGDPPDRLMADIENCSRRP
jgi:DNA-binding NarL/FixJ family response regulator